MPEFIVNDKLKRWIGFTSQPYIYKVEEGAIQRYAKAVGDSNPLYCDVEYAANSEYGRLMAPPGFVGWPVANEFDFEGLVRNLIEDGAPPENVDGGIEYEFLAPIGAVDILTMVVRVVELIGKQTKLGATLVTTYEVTYTNQRGIVALKARGTFLSYSPETGGAQ